MEKRLKSNLPAKLARGRERFEKWRRKHKTYRRLPEYRVFSASLRDMNFRGCYHIRRQQPYSVRTTYYEKSIEIEFAGQTGPWAGAF